MNKLIGSLTIGSMLACLPGCGDSPGPVGDGNHRSCSPNGRNIMKTVKMRLGGDFISESEEPLLRADDGDTYAGINVYRTEKNKDGASEEKYAYGLFKGPGDISIDVVTGYTYRFEATILTEKEHKLYVNKTMRQPFQYNTTRNLSGSASSFDLDDIGYFQYSDGVADADRCYLHQLAVGTAYVDAGDDLPSEIGAVWYPRIKRYYGINEGFDPGISESVDISMAYKCFGLKFEIVNLPSGTVTVKDVTKLDAIRDKSAEQALIFDKGLELSKDNKEWEAVYSMHDLLAESENFSLEFTWHKGGNVTEKFVSNVTVSSRTKKILKLSINGNPNYEAKGNINLIIQTDVLPDDVETITKDL